MATTVATFGEVMKSAITKAITEELDRIYEEKKQEMIEQIDKEKDRTIAGLAINIMEMVSMQEIGRDLRITVHTDRFKDK